MIIPSGRRTLSLALGIAALVGGALFAVRAHRLGLTLSHYDARGHLVVARRIFDSITPGWQQIGGIWLPLPHLLNALPVQVDAWYRNGASAVLFSIVSFALAVASIAWIITTTTGSAAAAVAGSAIFALNPNILYLQATPMTEPMFLGLTTSAIALLIRWCGDTTRPNLTGGVFALACLTRYEAWPVTIAALTVAVWVRWRQGESIQVAGRRVLSIAAIPTAAVVTFLILGRVMSGQWSIGGGFLSGENKAIWQPVLALRQIAWGIRMLSGPVVLAVAGAGLLGILAIGLLRSAKSAALIVLSLGAAATLPWLAFYEGHQFRIRYMVPLMALEATSAGLAVGLLPRARVLGALALLTVAGYELRPLDLNAPMIVEAQWDRPNLADRDRVTACIGEAGSGEKIMASMGSLGHYMQQASAAGFGTRDFLHEGNGDIWLSALADGPRPFAAWILIEEKANGGDMLALQAREHPHFLDGYSRVCEGAGMALYRREASQDSRLRAQGSGTNDR